MFHPWVAGCYNPGSCSWGSFVASPAECEVPFMQGKILSVTVASSLLDLEILYCTGSHVQMSYDPMYVYPREGPTEHNLSFFQVGMHRIDLQYSICLHVQYEFSSITVRALFAANKTGVLCTHKVCSPDSANLYAHTELSSRQTKFQAK